MVNEQVFNLKFVEEIEKRPILYNCTLSDYSRKDLRELAWNEVAEEVGMEVAACKERWKNLRAVFIRRMKSDSKNLSQYYLAGPMQFAYPYIKSLSKASGDTPNIPYQVIQHKIDKLCEEIDSNDGNVENLQSSTSLERTPSKLSEQPIETRSEALRMFLLSMLPDLESMTEMQVRQFKRKCLQSIDEILSPLPSSPASMNSHSSQIPYFNDHSYSH